MSRNTPATMSVLGIDIGKNAFHVSCHDERGAIVLRQKWSLPAFVRKRNVA